MINLPSFPRGGRDSDWWEDGWRRKSKKRGERWKGGGARELACLFCMLITDVGKACSGFCWEAFIVHEKAGCLLKKLSPGQRGGEGTSGVPQGRGLLLPWSCVVGRREGLEPWLLRVPQSLGGKGVLLYFKATSSMVLTDCFPGEVFV